MCSPYLEALRSRGKEVAEPLPDALRAELGVHPGEGLRDGALALSESHGVGNGLRVELQVLGITTHTPVAEQRRKRPDARDGWKA